MPSSRTSRRAFLRGAGAGHPRAVADAAAQFVAFARRFGPPEPHVIDQFHHPEDPNILILSNVVDDGEPQGLADAGTYFHTDYSYLAGPGARDACSIRSRCRASGGDTLFANQYAAYDGLPESMKRQIESLVGIHHYGNRNDQDEASRTAASRAHRRAEGEDAADHAPARAPASGTPAARRSTPCREARSASRHAG